MSSSEDEAEKSIVECSLLQAQLVPNDWDPGLPHIVKYVDDILGCEPLHTSAGRTHYSINRTTSTIHARRSEEVIDVITERALRLGLKVNGKKTQMMCVQTTPNTRIKPL